MAMTSYTNTVMSDLRKMTCCVTKYKVTDTFKMKLKIHDEARKHI